MEAHDGDAEARRQVTLRGYELCTDAYFMKANDYYAAVAELGEPTTEEEAELELGLSEHSGMWLLLCEV